MAVSGVGEGTAPATMDRTGDQRRKTREADLSTEQAGTQAPSRLSRAHGDQGRPPGARRTSGPWTQAAQRLTPAQPAAIPDGAVEAAGRFPGRRKWGQGGDGRVCAAGA